MATPAGRLIHDQNLDIHSTGALLGGKVDVSRPAKKGALGARRALNDISNSGKPSALQPSRKHNSINVISTVKDLGESKANFSKPLEKKGNQGGRKALSAKPSVQNLSKKSQDKKLSAVAGENVRSAIKEEAFLHNHQECLKTQKKTMSYGFFLETIGLDKGSSLVLPESLELKPDSPVKSLEMEEMAVILNEDNVFDCREAEFLGYCSPKSVKPAYESWKDEKFLDFKLIESPKLQK